MKIYLDNAATTRVHNEVIKAVTQCFSNFYGNPSSQHSIGREANEKLESSRKKIADHIGCNPKEIIFTSGGTESNNLAIRGLAKANPDKKHIITSNIEHPSVLETCQELEKDGYKVDYIKVNKEGIIDAKEIENKITKDTLLVSIMQVNNEIGTIQPVEEITKICQDKKTYFHTDWVQGFKKVDLNLKNIDLASVSGHKVNAPKGVGFLYVKKGTKISSIQTGGGQENSLRSGTENLPSIVGLAKSTEIKINKTKIQKSRDKILNELLKVPGTKLNGSKDFRVYNNINVSFYGIEGESLMLLLDKEGMSISTGSACASTKLSESHVLIAIGADDMYIHGSIRMSLGEDAIDNEDFIIDKINKSIEKLRKISPFKFGETECSCEGCK